MKIFYFNIKGRAETARLLLNLGGKPFEDVRFMGEEWFGKYKAMSPSGQVCARNLSTLALLYNKSLRRTHI